MNTTRTNRTPGTTYTANVSDAVHQIDRAKLHKNDMQAVYARIHNGTNDGKYAYGTDPVQGGIGHPLATGETKELFGFKEIFEWRFINAAATAASDLTITIFYA